jgi:hypothetical protein
MVEPISLTTVAFIAAWGYFFGTGLEQTAHSGISSTLEKTGTALLTKGEKIIENQLIYLSSKATRTGFIAVGSATVVAGVTIYYFKRRMDKLDRNIQELKEEIRALQAQIEQSLK